MLKMRRGDARHKIRVPLIHAFALHEPMFAWSPFSVKAGVIFRPPARLVCGRCHAPIGLTAGDSTNSHGPMGVLRQRSFRRATDRFFRRRSLSRSARLSAAVPDRRRPLTKSLMI